MGLYNALFFGGLVLAIIFLILSVILFFVLDVPKAFGVVTGKTQRKAIEEIRSGGAASSTKSKRNRLNLGNIQARDVDVSSRTSGLLRKDKTSGILGKERTSGLLSRKKKFEDVSGSLEKERLEKERLEKEKQRMNDAAAEVARKAAEDAKATSARDKKKAVSALEEEDTEILTYQEMKNKDGSEDTTSVLEMEQATDILMAGEEMYDEEGDAETDVLTGELKARLNEEYDAEETDLLRVNTKVDEDDGDATALLRHIPDEELYDDDLDEEYNPEVDKTDVLTVDEAGLTSDDIYGTYNPEMTAVLRSDMAPGEHSVRSSKGENLPGITVIYSETIVHTEESL
jgi:hypothetical protein